jgi:hypothetical protein
MPRVYRISQPGREPITDVDSVEAVEGVVRDSEPGPFHVDEIRTERFPSGRTPRACGRMFGHPDGRVEDDQRLWPE